MKRRYQGAWKERGGRGKSINPSRGGFQEGGSRRGRQRQKKGRAGGGGGEGERKIAFRLCSVKGEITHLRRFFQATTASIDQATGFMSQFPTWNIDTENPFSPCLLAFPPFSPSFSRSLSRSIKRPAVCGRLFPPVTLAVLIRAVKWRCFDCGDDTASAGGLSFSVTVRRSAMEPWSRVLKGTVQQFTHCHNAQLHLVLSSVPVVLRCLWPAQSLQYEIIMRRETVWIVKTERFFHWQ